MGIASAVSFDCFFQLCVFCFIYGCKTLSVKLRSGHRLREFENRALRNIFSPKEKGTEY
jgi:hypothetical protein